MAAVVHSGGVRGVQGALACCCRRWRLTAVLLACVPVFIAALAGLLVSARWVGSRRGVMSGGLRRLAFAESGVWPVAWLSHRNGSVRVIALSERVGFVLKQALRSGRGSVQACFRERLDA